MPDYLPPRRQSSRYRASRFATPVGQGSPATYSMPAAPPQKDDGGGFLGTGIGPDINLGVGRLFSEITQGVTGLVGMLPDLAPGGMPAGERWSQVGKSVGSSLAGTALNVAEPFAELATLLAPGSKAGEVGWGSLRDDDKVSPLTGAREAVGRFLGSNEAEDAALTPTSLNEQIRDRGLLPALAENIGNLSLVGGAVTAPVKGASMAAKLAGRTEAAARFTATHGRLIQNPIVRAVQHPYRTLAENVRQNALIPAAERVATADRIMAGSATDAPGDLAPSDLAPSELAPSDPDLAPSALAPDGLPDADNLVAAAPEPVQAGDRFLASMELRLRGLDARRVARDNQRMAEVERSIAARSPAVRASVHTARDLILDKASASGRRVTRKQASQMVQDEIDARRTGVKALELEYPDVPRDVWVRLGIRQAFIPDELWADGALEGSLAGATALQADELAKVRTTLTEGRVGDTGLTGLAADDAMAPATTATHDKLLDDARKKLDRANSDVLARKELRERTSTERQIAFQEDRLGRIAEHRQRVAEDEVDALAEFDHSRAGKIPAFRTPERLAASVQQVYERTVAEVERNGGAGGASFSPHSGKFVAAGEDTGYAVGLIPGTGLTVPVDEFTPQHIEQVVRAHQDVFQHPNTVVGTWVSDGMVEIAPSEVVDDFADALVRGAAREQPAIFDIGGVETPTGILKGRPDIAAPFLNRHKNLSRRTNELLDLTKTSALEYGDVPVMVDFLMRQAARAQELGLVKHPDEFFAKHVTKRRPPKSGVLRQMFPRDPAALLDGVTPEDLDDLAANIAAITGDDSVRRPDDLLRAVSAFAEDEAARMRRGQIAAKAWGATDTEAPSLTGRRPDLAAAAGDYEPLMQAFRDKVLGEFVPLDAGSRGILRVFEDGNLATLGQENGRVLRRLLPPAELRAIEDAYQITSGRWTDAAEGRLANDLLKYARGDSAPAGLEGAFATVRTGLSDAWEMVRGSVYRGRVHPTLRNAFDSWLDPALRETPDVGVPDLGPYPGLPVEAGTLRQRAARPPKLPDPPATKRDFYASGRKGQQALARLEKAAATRRSLAASEAKAKKAVEDMRTVLVEGRLPSQLERDALRADAAKLMERVDQQLTRPSVSRTPVRWRPLWQAVLDLEKEAATNPALADMLADLPQTFDEIQRLALDNGFDPAHVRDFSPTQVRRLVFGNLRLGKRDLLHEERAGTRTKSTGALRRAGGVEKSVEAFLAASVEAISEKRTNAVIDWVETSAARTIERGTPIPAGWVTWDPVRTYLLTGTELTEDGLRQLDTAATTTRIVPESVSKTLYRFSKDYDHWSLRAIRKVTSPWRTLVLTLSPGWYVRNVVGNIMLAEAEGVSLRDWRAAWRSARTTDEIGRFADIPFVTSDTLAQEAALMADESVIPRRGVREAQAESGVLRGTVQHAARKMLRVNEVVDEFARSAVYHQGLRRNMPPEQAWKRAKTSLVDYNALSPFERQVVRSVIPFYAWQKGILKITVNQALDHPARTSLLMLLGQMQEEYLADRFGVDPQDIPAYYKHVVGNRNLRSFNPFADAGDLTSVEGIMRSFNPFLELAIRKGLGAPEFYTQDQRLGYFGSPQQDVDVPSALAEMVTRSPGGRILGGGGSSASAFGIPAPIDDAVLRSRFLKARRQVRGIPNPETGTGVLPTRP